MTLPKNDQRYEEAQLEARRLRRLWEQGQHNEVVDTLTAPECHPWFVVMVVAMLCDGLDVGERGDLLHRIRIVDAAMSA